MTTPPLALGGQYGSPYSLKMRAVLRYRHIPFRWVLRDSKWDDIGEAPVPIIPVIVFPDGEAMVDSSPQIMRLEDEFEGRSIVPSDPALAFIDYLIEDFADEWVTKAMYHYRWAYEADIDKAGKLLPLSRDLQMDDQSAQQMYDFITSRQMGRRPLVGSTDTNQPVIEGSYGRLLDILQAHFDSRDFMFGERPARGDFGLFGQLSQLLKWDPTPMGIAVERAPKTINWVERMDDLSWLSPDDEWLAIDALGDTVDQLLAEIGRTYAPFMLANAAAIELGADDVVCQIDGSEYRQAPFKYQGKCLQWLREEYEALAAHDQSRVDALLAGTGCEALFT
ncbi:MAG: glutathione S-transferase N-terminal domain-containing protein [Actinomycetota bacterium]|jgi:glutathione S-transferase|nr:glutathione S-transferase N-terminal domain-containing protein [Actinomycetota bacterium]